MHHSQSSHAGTYVIIILTIIGMVIWAVIKNADASNTSSPRPRLPGVTPTQQKAERKEQDRLALYNAHGWVEQDIAIIDQMTGVEFEQYIARMIRSYGCSVKPTKTTGDFGVDLIVNGIFAVQCKRQAKAVGVPAIQQVITGARMHDCSEQTIVISNQNYTVAARSLSDRYGVMLFGRDNLPEMKGYWQSLARHGDLSA